MADYDIFREQLAIKFPAFGHALWDPSPPEPNRPVKVGDVGFIRKGKFHCLFNVLQPKAEQSSVPTDHEQLVPESSNHITQATLSCGNYCSVGVGVQNKLDTCSSDPDDFERVLFKHSRQGAVLSLPVKARREDTLAQGVFGECMVKRADYWFAFAQQLDLQIENMEEIILVTGCDRTVSWTNVTFFGDQDDAQASFGVKHFHGGDPDNNIQFSRELVEGAVLTHGPEGTHLPENQTIFIRGFRVARTSKIRPRPPISAIQTHRDPLRVLLDYISEQAPDCDMALIHDNVLERICGIGEDSSLETLQPDVVMDLLQRSNIEIHKVCYDLSPAGSPNADTSVVWVAMLSTLSENWSSVPHSQRSTPVAPWQNPGLAPCRVNESPVRSPSALPDCSSVLRIPGDIDLGDSAPLGSADGPPTLDEIGRSLSVVWSSLSTYAERHQLVPTIVIAYFMASVFGCIFPLTWLDMPKHWSPFLFASSVWFVWSEREHTNRKLDEMHETIKAILHHMTSPRPNPPTPALVAKASDILPIAAKTTVANQEQLCNHQEADEVRTKSGAEGHQKAKEDTLEVVAVSECPPPPPFNLRRQGSPATFGSIDDVLEPISSPLAFAPAAKPADGTIFFGSVAVQNGGSDSANPAVTRQPRLLSDPSTSSSQAAPAAASTPFPSPKVDRKTIAELFSASQSMPAISPIHHPPQPSSQPHPSIISPPSTPPAPTRPTSLSANAGAFIPVNKVSIKTASGQEVALDTLTRRAQPATLPTFSPSLVSIKKESKRRLIRIESQEQKEKRLAEERANKRESEVKTESIDALAGATEAAACCEIEEQVRYEAEERKEKEEAERAEKERKEAEERAVLEKERKEAEERAAQEEQERREAEERAEREAREKEEQEFERMRLEEQARVQREAEEEAEKERVEQEQLRKLQEEEGAPAEEAERQRKAEEDKVETVEASENAPSPSLHDDAEVSISSLPEEGDVDVAVPQPATTDTEEPASANKSAAALQPPPSTPPTPHTPAELSVKPVEEPQRIDPCLPPSPEQPQNQPASLDFQTAINANIAPPLPSALATARHIEDINCITYPQGIKSPKLELNVNTQKGKFRYDRDFLLQFVNICKEKPDDLPPLDFFGFKPTDTSRAMSRGGSGRNRSSNSLSITPNTQSASLGLGLISPLTDKSAGSEFRMGQFSTSASKMSSEERFLAASASRVVSVTDDPLGSPPPATACTIRQSDTRRNRTRSKRGATDPSHASVTGNASLTAPISALGPPTEPVAPLEMSANRWVATSTSHNGAGVDPDSPDMVDRKVKALLNKLTMVQFDSISNQIIAWANKSERENDGRTLAQVIKLVFEMATNGTMFSELYARLCRTVMEQISPKVQDDGIKNAEGKPFAGGQLFRKYLLNRCQEDFERGWVDEETTAAAAATKATEDRAIKEAGGEESRLYSDEYYAAAKAKRRGLGLIRFLGELYKLQMLTERIIHECIKKLLGNMETPEMEDIESLCELLTTVGSLLDTQKARAYLDVYFSRMQELMKNQIINARMVSMLQGVIELRERRWVPRSTVASPTTTAQVPVVAKDRRAQMKGPDEVKEVTGEAVSLQVAPPALSLAEVNAKIEEDTKEFFSIRMLDEAESYFSGLSIRRRHLLVDALATKSMEMQERDVALVSELFVRVREKGLAGPRVFERGFNDLAQVLDDLAVDIPKAWSYFAILVRGSGLDQDEERRVRIAEKTMDPDKLNSLL